MSDLPIVGDLSRENLARVREQALSNLACVYDEDVSYDAERHTLVLVDALLRVQELLDEWQFDRDTCLAWLENPEMHTDADHPRRLSDAIMNADGYIRPLRRAIASRQACECAPDCAERIACLDSESHGHSGCGWCETHNQAMHICQCRAKEQVR
jgi:hypothetical protein